MSLICKVVVTADHLSMRSSVSVQTAVRSCEVV